MKTGLKLIVNMTIENKLDNTIKFLKIRLLKKKY